MIVLAIDIGFRHFAYAVVEKRDSMYHVIDLKMECLLDKLGMQSDCNINNLPSRFLIEQMVQYLDITFKRDWLIHHVNKIGIESQGREGSSNKMGEVALATYTYFLSIVAPSSICCCLFPEICMIDPKKKFNGDSIFGVMRDACTSWPNLAAKPTYKQRKMYAEQLINMAIQDSDKLIISQFFLEYFSSLSQQHDASDALILANILLEGQ